MRTCRIVGCTGKVSRYGAYCGAHSSRKRRHGDAKQHTTTAAALKPYRVIVRRRLRANAATGIGEHLTERWRALSASCAAYAQRPVGYRPERLASQEIAKLAAQVEPEEIIETATAMVVMRWHGEPHSFASDDAFLFQLARRVRGLGDMHAERVRGRRRYRELPPKATRMLAEKLMDAFGLVGLKIAQLETKAEEKRMQETAGYRSAVARIA